MTERNERGNRVIRDFVGPHRERYHYDFERCTPAKGWKQYDTSQDASYFGVWVHIKDRIVLTFAEGDETTVICPSDEHLRAELESLAAFYGDPPPAFRAIDSDGTVTEYFDERPALDA